MTKKKAILIVAGVVLAAVIVVLIIVMMKRPVVMISSEETSFGDSGYFTLSAKNIKDVIGAEFLIGFDKDAITITEIENGKVFDSVSVSEEDYANNNGTIEVMYLDYTGGDKPTDANGDILYVKYTVNRPEDTILSLDKVSFVDTNMEYMKNFRIKDGKIKVNEIH